MSTRHFFLIGLTGFAMLLAGAGTRAAEPEVPEVIRTLEAQGLTHVQKFDTHSDLQGYAAVAGQDPVAIYVTPDGHAIVGTRIGPDGKSVDEARLDELLVKPMSDTIWSKLTEATWVRDGKKDAPRVVYTFSDPNCPYCNRFWEQARPWVDAGKVQLRHVMVGVIKADSSTKAAAILGAPDPTKALVQNEHTFKSGGIKPAPSVPKDVQAALDGNQQLMMELGFRGTPGIVYQNEDGLVHRVNGLPRPEALPEVLGEP